MKKRRGTLGAAAVFFFSAAPLIASPVLRRGLVQSKSIPFLSIGKSSLGRYGQRGVRPFIFPDACSSPLVECASSDSTRRSACKFHQRSIPGFAVCVWRRRDAARTRLSQKPFSQAARPSVSRMAHLARAEVAKTLRIFWRSAWHERCSSPQACDPTYLVSFL